MLNHYLCHLDVFLLLRLISKAGQGRWDAGSCGERFDVRELSPHPHIPPQRGLSSGQPAFPDLQADSASAGNLVIFPVSAFCPTGWAGSQLLALGWTPPSSRGLQVLHRRDLGTTSSTSLLCCWWDWGPRKLRVLWSNPKWVHISHPPYLWGSLYYLPAVLPAGAPSLWNDQSPHQASDPQKNCNLDQAECKMVRHLLGFLRSAVVKNLPVKLETGFDPWVGKIP